MAITIEQLKKSLSDLSGGELADVQCSLIRVENILPKEVSEALFIGKIIGICSEVENNNKNATIT